MICPNRWEVVANEYDWNCQRVVFVRLELYDYQVDHENQNNQNDRFERDCCNDVNEIEEINDQVEDYVANHWLMLFEQDLVDQDDWQKSF